MCAQMVNANEIVTACSQSHLCSFFRHPLSTSPDETSVSDNKLINSFHLIQYIYYPFIWKCFIMTTTKLSSEYIYVCVCTCAHTYKYECVYYIFKELKLRIQKDHIICPCDACFYKQNRLIIMINLSWFQMVQVGGYATQAFIRLSLQASTELAHNKNHNHEKRITKYSFSGRLAAYRNVMSSVLHNSRSWLVIPF